jgi:hypothetical protein
LFINTFDNRPNKIKNTRLKWEKWNVPLRTKKRFSVAEKLGMTALNDFLQTKKVGFNDFTFQEDWAKVIHLWDNKFFLTGGSSSPDSDLANNLQHYIGQAIYSRKAFIIDTGTGIVQEKPPMHYKRQAHGMVMVGNFVYCCAGLDGFSIISSCERYDL